MKRQYHIAHRADDKSASIIQQFCQSNGQILRTEGGIMSVMGYLMAGSFAYCRQGEYR